MKLWEIIVAAVVLFLVWGKLSKKVVPSSCISTTRPVTPLLQNCSSGDNFAGGKTTVAGVTEPPSPITLSCDARDISPISAPHIIFPVNPPLNTAPPIPVFRPSPAISGGGFYRGGGGGSLGSCSLSDNFMYEE